MNLTRTENKSTLHLRQIFFFFVKHMYTYVCAGLCQQMCFSLWVVVGKFEKYCHRADEGKSQVRGALIFWLSLCDSGEGRGDSGSHWRSDCGIDFRISSVTLLDPENDRGLLCYSPGSRNATILSFLFQMLLILPDQKAPFCLGKQVYWSSHFLLQLRHSESCLNSEDSLWCL